MKSLSFMGVTRIVFMLYLLFCLVMFAFTDQHWPNDIPLYILLIVGCVGIYLAHDND